MNTEQKKDFFNAKLGLFIHFGLYSLLGRGEWIMYRERISPEDYARLADRFRPAPGCVDAWCRFAARNGMKYAVLTTCHHDGFALFDSKADPFSSVNAPCGRDFVAEFVEACRRHGLKTGLYFSLGNWRYGIMKESDSAEKAARMRETAWARIRELMTQYGKIDILWYDGGWCWPSRMDDTSADVERFWRGCELNAMVRSLQKDILINDRAGDPADIRTFEGTASAADGGLSEACFTLGENANSHWGFFRNEKIRKSNAEIVSLLTRACAGGYNLMLNVGPDASGAIPAWQKSRLDHLGRWIRRNPDAVHGVRPTDAARDVNFISGNEYCSLAEKDGVLYAYFLNYPSGETFLPVMKREIVRAELPDGTPLRTMKKNNGLLLEGFPPQAPDADCTIVRLYSKPDPADQKEKEKA